ncbi:MAG: hypothetical protein R3C32_14365 [Chloroflexota bacterium]
MLQRLIGVSIGALVTFILLLVFYGTTQINGVVSPNWRIVGDSTQAFLVASVLGAVASFFWPIVVGWWLARRVRRRRDDEIQAEVQRQMADQQRPTVDRRAPRAPIARHAGRHARWADARADTPDGLTRGPTRPMG